MNFKKVFIFCLSTILIIVGYFSITFFKNLYKLGELISEDIENFEANRENLVFIASAQYDMYWYNVKMKDSLSVSISVYDNRRESELGSEDAVMRCKLNGDTIKILDLKEEFDKYKLSPNLVKHKDYLYFKVDSNGDLDGSKALKIIRNEILNPK